jgi:hypothetical protein
MIPELALVVPIGPWLGHIWPHMSIKPGTLDIFDVALVATLGSDLAEPQVDVETGGRGHRV